MSLASLTVFLGFSESAVAAHQAPGHQHDLAKVKLGDRNPLDITYGYCAHPCRGKYSVHLRVASSSNMIDGYIKVRNNTNGDLVFKPKLTLPDFSKLDVSVSADDSAIMNNEREIRLSAGEMKEWKFTLLTTTILPPKFLMTSLSIELKDGTTETKEAMVTYGRKNVFHTFGLRQ